MASAGADGGPPPVQRMDFNTGNLGQLGYTPAAACPGGHPGSRKSPDQVRNAPVAQLDRVPPSEGGGRGFESLRARQSPS